MGRRLDGVLKSSKLSVTTRSRYMTAAPYFAEPPAPPEPGTQDDLYWRKEFTLNYAGGSITAARGNILQTMNVDAAANFCDVPTISVTVKKHPRTNVIGGLSREIDAHTYSVKQYPISRASSADGGQAITVVTPLGEYTARLSGSAADFSEYLCANLNILYGATSFVTERGTQYGPFSPGSSN